MFVSRQIINGVCFVCEYADGNYKPRGTAFFMGMPLPLVNPPHLVGIVITALHVIAMIEQRKNRIFLRVNTNDGGFDYVELPFADWTVPDHADGIVDAAACWFPHDNKQKFDFQYLAEEHLATTSLMEAEDIGIGDEVYLAGLFASHAGEGRNEPIVRTGNIAAMPREEVLTTQGYMRAYLIESRSVGGLSGSPVFVDVSLFRQGPDGVIQLRGGNSRAWYLIGLIRGHWDAKALSIGQPESDVDFDGVGEDGVGNLDERDERVNMGIAIVTPIERVMPLVHEAVEQVVRRAEETINRALSGLDPDQIAKALLDIVI